MGNYKNLKNSASNYKSNINISKELLNKGISPLKNINEFDSAEGSSRTQRTKTIGSLFEIKKASIKEICKIYSQFPKNNLNSRGFNKAQYHTTK